MSVPSRRFGAAGAALVHDAGGLVAQATLDELVSLGLEIAFEGREGRQIGTLFVMGDADEVAARSRPLLLDPLAGHPRQQLHVTEPVCRETVKALAQLDGAFLVDDEGYFRAAALMLEVLPGHTSGSVLGFGARHAAAASITAVTRAVAVVVSQSRVVRIFAEGDLQETLTAGAGER